MGSSLQDDSQMNRHESQEGLKLEGAWSVRKPLSLSFGADSDGRLAPLQGLSKTYQILREHANSATAWAVKVRDEKERDA
jgi:hypothetical protein